ncbi:MAG: hypothetical protein U0521_25145 [Anaerolineae bacterium]
MVAAIAALAVLVVIPVIPQTAENRSVDDYLTALLCEPGGRVVRDQYSYTDFDGTGFSMTVYCETGKNIREDVTTKWTLVGIAAFLVPFLLGLLLFIVGITRRAMKAVNSGGMVRVGGFSGNPNVVVTPYGSSTSPIEGIEFNDGVLRVGGVQVTTDGFGAEAGRHFRAASDPRCAQPHRQSCARFRKRATPG